MFKNLLILILLILTAGLTGILFLNSTPTFPVPLASTAATSLDADVRLIVQESYLERQILARLAQAPAARAVRDIRIDLKPGNQVLVRGSAQAFGVAVPLSIDLRLTVASASIRAQVVGGQAGPIALPAAIRQEVEESVNDVLGEALRIESLRLDITGVQTDESAINLALRERPR